MKLDLVVTTDNEKKCEKCKFFKGDATKCEKCGLTVYRGFACYSYAWKLTITQLENEMIINGNQKIIEITGDKVIIVEPLFGFEPKEAGKNGY